MPGGHSAGWGAIRVTPLPISPRHGTVISVSASSVPERRGEGPNRVFR